NSIKAHEQKLTAYALEEMKKNPAITVHGPQDPQKQGGTILFEVNGIPAHEVALALDQLENIAIRSGMHCAQPFVNKINPAGLCRASFYLYTTREEIDRLVSTLSKITEWKK
ncbi:MAG: aminotransferase class V-fold PLP-dependent enzyme, partial [Candidatus Diapherotrites archaeon]|nr:aminotransferase class V-fold PLP-dependent enzyme [Candidatus Diapherotrites archaeon]